MEAKKQQQSQSPPLKKMIGIPHLLLSLSLFSFLLSYPSLLSNSSLSLSPKFHHYFSATANSSSHLFTKNCLFLICNALLVFLAKTSGFIQPPTTHELTDMLQISALDKYVLEEESHGGKDESDAGPKEVSIFIAESEEEEEEASSTPDSTQVDEDHENQTCWLFDDDGEQQLYGDGDGDGDGDGEESVSTEELNQKFEDFIRKMKEEIIINETRQKVVVLN